MREIFDDIDRLFAKIAELQKQPADASELRGFQRAAHPLSVIESMLGMARVEQQRRFLELDDERGAQ